MAYKCTTKGHGVGETSSKYGYKNGEDLFIADLEKNRERAEFLWTEFVGFMHAHEVRPDELRSMFARYYEEFVA